MVNLGWTREATADREARGTHLEQEPQETETPPVTSRPPVSGCELWQYRNITGHQYDDSVIKIVYLIRIIEQSSYKLSIIIFFDKDGWFYYLQDLIP